MPYPTYSVVGCPCAAAYRSSQTVPASDYLEVAAASASAAEAGLEGLLQRLSELGLGGGAGGAGAHYEQEDEDMEDTRQAVRGGGQEAGGV